MPYGSSDYQNICPGCGKLYENSNARCPGCGKINPETPVAKPVSRNPKTPHGAMLPDVSFLLKVTLFLAFLALPAWLVYHFGDALFRSIEQASPYPTSPAETTSEFFDSLQNEDYQNCYGLLAKDRKMATVIGKNSRDKYFAHFSRVRHYLSERVDPDFTWDMDVAYDGKRVEFGHKIVLTLSLVSVRGADKLSHYAITDLNEFPIDIAPDIGIEKHNRMLNRMVESLDAMDQNQQDMEVADILESRPHESSMAKRDRWIEAFQFQRQLDTRHTLLEWIVREYPNDSTVNSFLTRIARDETQAMQLRKLAQ